MQKPGPQLRSVQPAGVLADAAANDDARAAVDQRYHGVGDPAAHVVKVHVHAASQRLDGGTKRISVAKRLVVQRPVQAQCAGQPVALGLPTGQTQHTAAMPLGKLRHQRAHGSGSARHHHHLPGTRPATFRQAKPGRAARHAQNAQRRADRGQRRVQLADGAVVAACMGLPAQHALNPVAHRQCAGLGGDNAPHHACVLHGVERMRLSVVGGFERLVDAHVRVHADVLCFDQHLTVGQRHRQRRTGQHVMLGPDQANGAIVVDPFLMLRGVGHFGVLWVRSGWGGRV